MIHASSLWRKTGNTTLGAFRSSLSRSISKTHGEMLREAEAIYDAVSANGLSRLAAAMAWTETKNFTYTCDTAPSGLPCIPAICRNPWAMTKSGDIGSVGRWAKYGSFVSAAKAWSSRLLDPNGAYASSLTIEEMISIYAPPFENSVELYVSNVCKEINSLPLVEGNSGGSDMGSAATKQWSVAGMSQPIILPADIRFEQRLIPAGQKNQRPGIPMEPLYWTQHDTGNYSAGANAEMHWRWLMNGAPGADSRTGEVGFHFVVDDRIIIQLVPVNEIAWHAGDGYSGVGNRSSIGCELCVNADRNPAIAERNSVELAAAMMRSRNWPVERLRTHYSWVRGMPNAHHCPDSLLSTGRWDAWAKSVMSAAFTTTQETWPGKPSWIPDSAVKILFPEAMANGPRTNAIFNYWNSVGRCPARQSFLYKGTPDELILLYDGTIIDVKGNVLGPKKQ